MLRFFFLFFIFKEFGHGINSCHRARKEVLTLKLEGPNTLFKRYVCQVQKDQQMCLLVCHRSRD